MPDLVFACVYLVLDLVHLTNCVALPGKFCSNAFKFHVNWKVCRRQVPAFPQPPQPPCNIAAMQAEVGIVQSRSLERSHNVQKLESVQVQVEEQNETGLWHVCLPPHIDTHCIENTKVVRLKDHRSAFNCLCLQSGKAI